MLDMVEGGIGGDYADGAKDVGRIVFLVVSVRDAVEQNWSSSWLFDQLQGCVHITADSRKLR